MFPLSNSFACFVVDSALRTVGNPFQIANNKGFYPTFTTPSDSFGGDFVIKVATLQTGLFLYFPLSVHQETVTSATFGTTRELSLNSLNFLVAMLFECPELASRNYKRLFSIGDGDCMYFTEINSC